MDFGEVIGFGVPAQARVLDRPADHRRGFREMHIAFVAPDRGGRAGILQGSGQR